MVCRFAKRQAVFVGNRAESFSLREMTLAVHLRTFAAPTTLRPARIEIGADVQIGGGVRVGDALQAIVEFEPIAIWVRKFCVEISQGEIGRRLKN
jgi:hypothetical protein